MSTIERFQQELDQNPGTTPNYALGSAPLEDLSRARALTAAPVEHVLGEGFDSVTGAAKGKAMAPQTATPAPSASGQVVEYSLIEVESLSELRREMGISASASYSGVVGEASAKVELVRKAAFNSYSIYLIVRTKVTNGSTLLTEFMLRSEARDLFQQSVPEFFKTYGDEFVNSVSTGGEFLAVVEFVSQSSVEQETIKASVRASVGSFDSAAGFSQAIDKISKERTTKINVVRIGGTGPIPTNLKEAAMNFPKAVDPAQGGAPVVIGFTTRSFDTVSNRPAGKSVPNLAPQRRAMSELVEIREYGQRIKNDIAYILDFPTQFANATSADLHAKSTKVDGKIASIDKRLNQIVDAPLNPPPATETDFGDVLPLNARLSGIDVPLKILIHQHNLNDSKFPGGEWAGAKDTGFPVEGFAVEFEKPLPGVTLEYLAHLQNQGDTAYKSAPDFIGTRGESRRLEGFAMKLTGDRAKYYKVVYKAFLSGVGEVGPADENGFCGTRGQGRALTAIQVKVVSR
jgi:hypothetical protein